MEPNKLENDFRDKLEQRRIQPSEMAWDRLDAMLSVTENKKPKKNRAWLYMAAALLIFLLAGILFLNQEKQNGDVENINNSVVTTEKKNSETVPNVIAPVTTEEIVVQSTPHKIKKSVTAEIQQYNSKISNKPSANVESIATNDKKEAQTTIQVTNDQELLASLNNETTKKRSSIKVDPNSLLSSVEGELNESYRSKAFQGVVKSFNTVKVAVANRNYE